jgi:hypothetical protein
VPEEGDLTATQTSDLVGKGYVVRAGAESARSDLSVDLLWLAAFAFAAELLLLAL